MFEVLYKNCEAAGDILKMRPAIIIKCLSFLFLESLSNEKENFNKVKREMESTLAEIQEMSV